MPPRILLEGCQLMLSEGTGIVTYARNLATAVSANGYAADVLVGTDKKLDPNDPAANAVSLFDAVRPVPWGPLRTRFRRRFGAPTGIRAHEASLSAVSDPMASRFDGFGRVLAATDLDALARLHFARHGKPVTVKLPETPALFHTTQPIPLRVAGCPNIYTIHDLVPLKLPSSTRDDKRYVAGMLAHLARSGDHIVTVSEFSRREIIDYFRIDEIRVTNTYQAVALPANALAWTEDEVARLVESITGIGAQEYFLFVGAIEPKKNLSRLIDAYAASGSRYPLLIAGGLAWQYEEEVQRIGDERFLSYELHGNTATPRRRVRRLSYLPREHLVALMRGARALLFPSLYEGFGLPVLEAMSVGTPVMTSNVTSLPEVAGDAALLVDPLDTDDIARGIRMLDNDDDLRAALKQRGLQRAALFSPEAYQRRIAALYRSVIG
ncbi:MAG TPA: glycosyltransferase family 1 protein [Stellaceae bacterium]|jgi:glycosyltransferase involved in cell wall biosynthesis|nr:glycosyltransferase family 1 protein [Stellaceae bacterium]